MKQKNHAGQSITEYMLIAAILGVGSIGALVFLTTNFDDTSPKFATQIFYGGRAAVPGQGNQPGSAPLWVSDPDAWRPVTMTLPSGQTITMPYPENTSGNLETAGANGATEQYLAALDTLLEEANVPGDLTEEQYASLSELSNKGHRIAALEKLVENVIQENNGGPADLRRIEVEFEGHTYNMVDIVQSLEGSRTMLMLRAHTDNPERRPSPFDLTAYPVNYQESTDSEIMNFVRAYHQAETSGALSSPIIEQMVYNLSSQIMVVGDSFAQTSRQPLMSNTRRGDYLNNLASDYTRANSRGICRAGRDTDHGTFCGG